MAEGMTRFERRGLDRLRRKLDRMPQSVKDNIRVAMDRNGEDLVINMKAVAPVAPNSGDLRDSITVTSKLTSSIFLLLRSSADTSPTPRDVPFLQGAAAFRG